MNTRKLNRSQSLLLAAVTFVLLAPALVSAQTNDKKALRAASGTYTGEEGPVGQAAFAFGTGRLKLVEKNKTATAALVEDSPSTVNTRGVAKIKRVSVRRGGKKIVSTTKAGRADEKMGTDPFATFTGSTRGDISKRGKKFSGDAVTRIDNEDDVFFKGQK